ncbi:MAG: glycosyltransferase [Gammaproteobacteria bacterium]|uniref:glycosyltransferase n=1 Tax=Limnobacter sp. TaxID=2003368 RepID=UPI001DB62C17|nr:glycosyltransferase [Limnobacter sp.]MBU0784765.1 glycosyltransferase [Gammaproteobacteria bacterium]MBU0848150.1 glycosyltransferase [Gammaproteobacteria bacterium]MBU1267141.1 glycosyltransferase [Gammaproteobacteria bacterium]MBU1528823.1 glycosyltransferase [Gammaproteobacteria bacterium]MBU1779813.1 glycosyltransferase [Gammaproteobacteria bacterium]
MNTNKVAYLINQYPKVSHTFIRREILALESLGLQVSRLSVRGWDNPVADPIDETERQKTFYLLQNGVFDLVRASVAVFTERPLLFLKALRAAFSMGIRADRPVPFHLMYLLEACKALQWLRKQNIGHVHAHFGANSTEVAMMIRLLGGPTYSFTVHGPEEFDKPEFIGLGTKVEHCAFVVAITSYCRSQIYRWIPQTIWNKVKVVRCGIEPDFHRDLPDAFPGEPRLVCVGRLCEQKGQLILLAAAARLKEQGVDLQLVLAGDGEMRPEIERQIDQLNLRNNVQITGWISSEQVREEILKSRAMVLPSFAEGLPVVVMEAMALRRPVISTYIAGMPELVIPGVNGFLCPAGDVNELAMLMETCLKADEGTLRELGDNAQRAVLEQHHILTEAGKLAALFTTLLRPEQTAGGKAP